jgi:hypothetical protein
MNLIIHDAGSRVDSQTIKFVAKKSKCAGFAQEIGFFCTQIRAGCPWLVKGVQTGVCTSKKECNKLELTVAQYF